MIEKERYKDLLKTLGKAGVNALFPKDFEYYMIALEIVNSRGQTEEYFVFPVMPNNIKHQKIYPQTSKVLAKGIVNYFNPNFTPIQISLSGNFGKKLKMVLGQTKINSPALAFSTKAGVYPAGIGIRTPIFSLQLKSGFGAFKILEAICEKSNKLDLDGNPYSLYLYNPAQGENYICKVVSLVERQSIEQNMIWGYDIELEALGEIKAKISNQGKFKGVASQIISEELSGLYEEVKAII